MKNRFSLWVITGIVLVTVASVLMTYFEDGKLRWFAMSGTMGIGCLALSRSEANQVLLDSINSNRLFKRN